MGQITIACFKPWRRRAQPGHAPLAAALGMLLAGLGAGPALANSPLLDSVKRNPQRARAICAELKDLNAKGVSYTSPQAVAQVGAQQGLNTTDAEILSTYVVGLYCPDVR
ncbi:MAG: hypothetical protein ACKOCA_05545 [Vulcanococcus sp.]